MAFSSVPHVTSRSRSRWLFPIRKPTKTTKTRRGEKLSSELFTPKASSKATIAFSHFEHQPRL